MGNITKQTARVIRLQWISALTISVFFYCRVTLEGRWCVMAACTASCHGATAAPIPNTPGCTPPWPNSRSGYTGQSFPEISSSANESGRVDHRTQRSCDGRRPMGGRIYQDAVTPHCGREHWLTLDWHQNLRSPGSIYKGRCRSRLGDFPSLPVWLRSHIENTLDCSVNSTSRLNARFVARMPRVFPSIFNGG